MTKSTVMLATGTPDEVLHVAPLDDQQRIGSCVGKHQCSREVAYLERRRECLKFPFRFSPVLSKSSKGTHHWRVAALSVDSRSSQIPPLSSSAGEPIVGFTVDPSGRRSDETGYAAIKMSYVTVFLTYVGGVTGGYGDEALEELAQIAKVHSAHATPVRSNLGD